MGPRLSAQTLGTSRDHERPKACPRQAPAQQAAVLIASTCLATFSMRLRMDIQRFLIGLGLLILVAGITWPILSRLGLGRLPGDIIIHRDGTTFYFPVVTCLIISIVIGIVLSVLYWLSNR